MSYRQPDGRRTRLTFGSYSELLETPWSEIDLKNERWIIPWQRMKIGGRRLNPRKLDHHVNLPRRRHRLLHG